MDEMQKEKIDSVFIFFIFILTGAETRFLDKIFWKLGVRQS